MDRLEDYADLQTPMLHPTDPIHEDPSLTVPFGTTRKISSSIFTTSFSTESSDSGIGINTFYEVPEYLRSVETIRYLGFAAHSADMLWKCWCDFDEEGKTPRGPYDLIDIVLRHIETQKDADTNSPESRIQKLEEWGFSQDACNDCAISEFWDLHATESAMFWALEMVYLRWDVLLDVWDTSRTRAEKQKMRRVGGQYPIPGTDETFLRGGGENDQTTTPPSSAPDYTTLYHGTTKRSLDTFHDSGNLESLHSRLGSDFRGLKGEVMYFALDFEVAYRYAKWALKWSPASSPKVLYMQVPNDFIEKCKPCILRVDHSTSGNWNIDDWKKIVWYSRRKERFPKELSHLQNHPLFFGHICRNVSIPIASLNSWQDLLPEKHAWILENGEKGKIFATQYVFNGLEVLDALKEVAEIGICP